MDSSSLPPKPSISLPLTSREGGNSSASSSLSPVLPTPSNSTSVRSSPTSPNSINLTARPTSPLQQQSYSTKLVELQHQLAEKEKQLQESSGGIEKNVLVRQIRQLQDKMQQLEVKRQTSPTPTRMEQQQPDNSSSTSSLTSTGTYTSGAGSVDQDQLAPETMEKLRYLERDLNSYRTSLIPGVGRKEKLLSQRSNGLNPLPSPSNSSMQESSSASLLPLPPPLAGSTPTKRRSKVPNNDRRNTDIEFATEIGQGLLLEVRKMQTLLQEKEEQLRSLQIQKADLERAAEALTKQLRQKDEAEERLKEETWNLELAKQELTMSVTELQQHLSKANVEQTKLNRQLADITGELEQVRGREDKLTAAIENLKTRHEQEMATVRRHMATMQREKTEQSKQLEVLSSELAIAKAQSRIAKKSHQDLTDLGTHGGGSGNTAVGSDAEGDHEGMGGGSGGDGTTNMAQLLQQQQNKSLSPSSSSTTLSNRHQQQQQAIEVETLKTSLGHAHRMVSTLRSNLHKEKTEKFELKKLLADSQELIEQMQNDPRMWEDAGQAATEATPTGHSNSTGLPSSAGTDPGARKPRRSRRRSHARMLSTNSRSNSTSLLKGNNDNSNSNNNTISITGEFRPRSSRVAFDDDDYSYSSFNSDDEEDDDDDEDQPDKVTSTTATPAGFTSLSMELSKSQQQQQQQKQQQERQQQQQGTTTSLSQELAKHRPFSPQPSSSTSSSSTSQQQKVHRSLGDELTLADAFRKSATAQQQSNNNDDKHQSSLFEQLQQQDPSNNEAFQDLLKGAAFGAAGTGLVSAIAQARAHRGVDVLTQTDEPTQKPAEVVAQAIQTDPVMVRPVVVANEIQIQTDDPPVGVDMAIQSITLPGCEQATQYLAPTPPVDQFTQVVLPTVVDTGVQSEKVTVTDMAVQSDLVYGDDVGVQSDLVYGDDVGIQSDQVSVTDMAVQSDPVYGDDVGVQSDLVYGDDAGVQSDKVSVADMGVQSDQVSMADMAVQSDPVYGADMGVQSDQVSVADMAVQSDSVYGADASVQSDQASIADVGVQSDRISVAHVGVQSDTPVSTAPMVEEKGVQTSHDGGSNMPLIAPLSLASEEKTNDNDKDKSIRGDQQTSTMGALLASGAAALGLGALVSRGDVNKNDQTATAVDDDDSKALYSTPQDPTALDLDLSRGDNNKDSTPATAKDDKLDNCDKGDDNESSASTHNVAPVNPQGALVENNNNSSTSEAIVNDKDQPTTTHMCDNYDNDTTTPKPAEEKTLSQSEADTMIAAAVAAALKQHKEDSQASTPSNTTDSTVTAPLSALTAGAIAKSLEPAQDKRHTCDMSANGEGADDMEGHPRESSDSKRSFSTEATTTSTSGTATPSNNTTMDDHQSMTMTVPTRPTSPPPPALLARSSMLLQNSPHQSRQRTPGTQEDKGKWPMHQTTPITPLDEDEEQVTEYRSLSAPMVNPNYYTKNQPPSSTGRHPGASTSSFASSSQPHPVTPTGASSLTTTEPAIALITDTMMGHWLWKHPRHHGFIRTANPHQRYVWIHPYTRTLYWSTHAPGAPDRDVKTKSALIQDMKVTPNGPEQHLPVSIQVTTSEGDMKLTAPDMDTHATWVESLEYILSKAPESTHRHIKPMHSNDSRTSRLLQQVFHHTNPSTTSSHRHSYPSHSNNDDYEEEKLDDLRMCCNGKHHLSHLERDRILPNRPKYPPKRHHRPFRHSAAAGH